MLLGRGIHEEMARHRAGAGRISSCGTYLELAGAPCGCSKTLPFCEEAIAMLGLREIEGPVFALWNAEFRSQVDLKCI